MRVYSNFDDFTHHETALCHRIIHALPNLNIDDRFLSRLCMITAIYDFYKQKIKRLMFFW